ncbi:hypothetical protein DFJ58DRAFT_760579 [Suillus subalutaceus]|uniref:uncharacterized protein n=1 Tax=Suillus subalutaceus TaxID=48586 RepID=UPI001B85FF62|nr:uncharacterized protein DFJ58DRAFT_760579 [Suillus subalutaceus]KAG1872973.1 hypothetical protein DFJ58DRAFT_760579 [Suillus subalutaceus]
MALSFVDIPLELLPIIFDFVVRAQHLASLCLVNKSFNEFAIQRLYRRVYIYAWHTEAAKSKVVLLFQTLSNYPRLAQYVSRLEIRAFPKALSSSSYSDLLDLCTRGIRNCVNLRSCAWTRDGSLESAILLALQQCPQLKELEINGRDSGYYDPNILTQFSKLSRISLIMPSAQVIEVLPSWISATGPTLRNLTLICQTSSLITDTLLESLAPSMTELDQLFIIGCPKVTHRGIGEIVSTNRNGLTGIGLERLSPAFDMSSFTSICKEHRAFRRLRSITLAVHIETPFQTWTSDVTELLSTAPLEILQIYATTPTAKVVIADDFWRTIVTMHGSRLKRFSIDRMTISMGALHDICSRCSVLEQLFVVTARHNLDDVTRCFSAARNLRAIHVNFCREVDEIEERSMMKDALRIVQQCPATVTQIGCDTRVWHVRRDVRMNDKGELYTVPTLTRYENPDIPEQFLVARGA